MNHEEHQKAQRQYLQEMHVACAKYLKQSGAALTSVGGHYVAIDEKKNKVSGMKLKTVHVYLNLYKELGRELAKPEINRAFAFGEHILKEIEENKSLLIIDNHGVFARLLEALQNFLTSVGANKLADRVSTLRKSDSHRAFEKLHEHHKQFGDTVQKNSPVNLSDEFIKAGAAVWGKPDSSFHEQSHQHSHGKKAPHDNHLQKLGKMLNKGVSHIVQAPVNAAKAVMHSVKERLEDKQARKDMFVAPSLRTDAQKQRVAKHEEKLSKKPK